MGVSVDRAFDRQSYAPGTVCLLAFLYIANSLFSLHEERGFLALQSLRDTSPNGTWSQTEISSLLQFLIIHVFTPRAYQRQQLNNTVLCTKRET